MRATKVPPRDSILAATDNAKAGAKLFESIGCATCHVTNITTAPAGTAINGGTFRVPSALGAKIIQPYGDFLLHDIGTGDGIVQNGGGQTQNKIRTAPLWGLRTRGRLMHDGQSLTMTNAIARHRREAATPSSVFKGLSRLERDQLLIFLQSFDSRGSALRFLIECGTQRWRR